MSLNHHRIQPLLSAYLDDELALGETALVQEHLLDCAACRRVYDDLRTMKRLLGQLPPPEPPAEFWAAIRAPTTRPSRPHPRVRLPIAARSPVWALAAALLVVVLAGALQIKGAVDRLHATEIGVDLYVREHALEMSTEPLPDRAYLGLVAGDADLVLAGEGPRDAEAGP
jgi:anti-sigma factor RsiW